ncbi:hypothetical protein ACJJTC_012197 [Scirpophaga incertulas]
MTVRGGAAARALQQEEKPRRLLDDHGPRVEASVRETPALGVGVGGGVGAARHNGARDEPPPEPAHPHAQAPPNNNNGDKPTIRQVTNVSTPLPEQRIVKERERERDRGDVKRDRQDHQPSNRDTLVYNNKTASPLDHRGANNSEENKVRRHPYLQQLIYPLLNEVSRKHGAGAAAAVEELRRAFEHAERAAPHLTRAFVQQVVQRVATQSHSPPTHAQPWPR